MEYQTPDCGEIQVADAMFVAAWRAELPELRRRALRLAAGQRDRADDLVADTAIKALLFMRRSPDAMTDPGGFLYVVLRHVFLDSVRRRKREAETIDGGASEGTIDNAAGADLAAPQWLELHDQLQRVVSAVAGLSRDQRRLFGYRFVDDLPYPVIAARLRITQPLARKRVQLLRQRLKAASDE